MVVIIIGSAIFIGVFLVTAFSISNHVTDDSKSEHKLDSKTKQEYKKYVFYIKHGLGIKFFGYFYDVAYVGMCLSSSNVSFNLSNFRK